MQELPAINRALQNGYHLHASLSGSGLRIASVEKDGVVTSQAMHPYLEGAIIHVNSELSFLWRISNFLRHNDEPRYLTGSSTPSSALDAWILRAGYFEIWQEDEEAVCKLSGYTRRQVPRDVEEQLKKQGGNVTWQERGFTYIGWITRLANDVHLISSQVVSTPADKPERNPDHWRITKTGRGKDLWRAAAAALEAPAVEVAEHSVV